MFRNASRSLTTSEEVYEYALTLLDRREHGEKELVQKLKRRCTSALLIREAVEKLKQYDLINEKRYAIRVFEASWTASAKKKKAGVWKRPISRSPGGGTKNTMFLRKKAWRPWPGIFRQKASAPP